MPEIQHYCPFSFTCTNNSQGKQFSVTNCILHTDKGHFNTTCAQVFVSLFYSLTNQVLIALAFCSSERC